MTTRCLVLYNPHLRSDGSLLLSVLGLSDVGEAVLPGSPPVLLGSPPVLTGSPSVLRGSLAPSRGCRVGCLKVARFRRIK